MNGQPLGGQEGVESIAAIHRPVLLEEVIGLLGPRGGGIYVDGNLGLGGHTEQILDASGPDGRVIGFDWDEAVLALARQRLARYGGRVVIINDSFAAMAEHLRVLGIGAVDGILLDLGLSSFQLDQSGRGFSFRGREPLDMRMDPRHATTAAELVNTASEEELADIFFYYGEERQARRIARFVVDRRKSHPFGWTDQLVEVIEAAVPARFRPERIHVATKVFQALRIAVNRELDQLQAVLAGAGALLKTGGRLCVIAFHSLEDRMVKNAMREQPGLRVLTKKPVVPGQQEMAANPRARSARLRVAERVN